MIGSKPRPRPPRTMPGRMKGKDLAEHEAIRRRLIGVLSLLLLIVALGTAGYMLIEGWPLLDAAYMTVITITTVGFGEVHPLSTTGREFTLALIVLGVGTVAYGLGTIAEYTVVTGLPQSLERRRRRLMLQQLREHYVICGFGRVGEQIANEFAELGVPFVVIDENQAALSRCAQAGFPYLEGDATDDKVLQLAHIERARGILIALDSDSENLYVVLSARSLRADLPIVVAAEQPSSEAKMLRAGANRVVSPYALGGRRMAAMALRPNVVEFLDLALHTRDRQLWIEEVEVTRESPLAELTIEQARLGERTGALVLALISPDGRLIANPPSDTRLATGSRLITLGSGNQLRAFCDLVASGTCILPDD